MARKVRVSSVALLLPEAATTVEANMIAGQSALQLALEEKPDIVCLPELFPIFNTPREEIRERAIEVQKDVLAWGAEHARESHAYLIVPTIEVTEGHLYNTAFLFDRDGRIAGAYRKTHLAPEEEKAFCVSKAGDDYPVFQTDFGKIAIMTCMDIHYPEVARIYALQGSEILFWPTMAYGPTEDFLQIALRARAIDNQLYCVASNYVNSPYLPGKLMGRANIVGLDGAYRADTGNRPGIATALLDLDEGYEMWYAGEVKKKFPTLHDTLLNTRRPDTYGILCHAFRKDADIDSTHVFHRSRVREISRVK